MPSSKAAAPASSRSKQPSSKKRKATQPPPQSDNDDDAEEATTQQQQQQQARPTKKPKQKKHANTSTNDLDALLDLEAGINTIFTRMDPDLLADHVAAKTKRFGGDTLSPIELADLYVPAGAIRDTTAFAAPRVKEQLPAFLEAFAGDSETDRKRLASAPKEAGAPHTLVVAGAGLRAADLVRAARKFQTKDSVVSKLFAKHFKVEEQVQFLKKNRTGIAIGTPARLMALMDEGALSVAHLKRIVIDASHIDQKKRGVMDMADTMMPLAKFLTRSEFKERYGDPKKPVELLFF